MLTAWLLAGCEGNSPAVTAAMAAGARDPGYSASGAEIIQTGADGAPRYRLRAAQIAQDPRTLEIDLQDIRLDTRARDATRWQVEAPRGRLSRNTERLRLEGGVRVVGGDAQDPGRVRIATPTLDYDLRVARASASGAVRITLQGQTLESLGLEADLRARQLRLGAAVHGRFSP